MRKEIVLSSRVRLARNFEDIPFDVSQRPEFAAVCVSRAVGAMKNAGLDKGFELFRLKDMSDAARKAMADDLRQLSQFLAGGCKLLPAVINLTQQIYMCCCGF